MKNNNILLSILMIIISGKLLFPHNEFQGVVNGAVVNQYIVLDETIIDMNVVHWNTNYASNLKIFSNNLSDLNEIFPENEMTRSDAVTDFNLAVNKWQNEVSKNSYVLNTNVQSNDDAINIEFSATESDFGNNMNAYARIVIFVDINKKEFAMTNSTDYARIRFNSCAGRYENNIDPWQWATQNPDTIGWVDWESVCLHELGHVLGLSHCTAYDMPVMGENLEHETTNLYFSNSDKQGIDYMCRCIFQGPGNYPISTTPILPSTTCKTYGNKGVIK
jgi:hypothetical protein